MRRTIAFIARTGKLSKPSADCFANLGNEAGRLKIAALHKEILREILRIRFERNHAAGVRGKLPLHHAAQARAAHGYFRPGVFTLRHPFAAQE